MRNRSAVFPGSFDPFTNGHLDIALRAAEIFDLVYVAVLNNAEKSPLLKAERRVELIARVLGGKKGNFKVECFDGLLVEYLRKVKVPCVVRGLRATTDYEYETQMALMNRHLDSSVETLFMVAREEHSYISSSMVKQVVRLGGDISALVPKAFISPLLKSSSK